MRRVRVWGPLACALGCTFDASGVAESSAAGPGSSGSGGSTGGVGSTGAGPGPGAPTTGGEGTQGGSTGGVEPVTTGGPGGSTTAEEATTTGMSGPGTSDTSGPPDTTGDPPDDTTTTGAPGCPQAFKQIVLVQDASVVAPMAKYQSNVGEGTVAYSKESEQGLINFPIELACDTQVAVWARVLDAWDGVHASNDPDSFYPHVDNQAEQGWPYGCQTQGLADGYHWLRVRMGVVGDPCDTFADLTPQLGAGAHTITLRNREGEANNDAVAAIARILVTSDLGYVPQNGE